MKKIKNNINPEEVIEKIHENLAAVKKGIAEGNFSKSDISELREEFLDLELQALKTKVSFELHVLFEKDPNLSTKEVLIKVLQLLPEKLNEAFLPILTDYVFQNWKVAEGKKLAA